MTALFVELDANTLKDAEERELREQRAQSAIVSRARRDHRAFWQRIDARTAQEEGTSHAE